MTDENNNPVDPFEQLKQEAEQIKEKWDKEVVNCPECGTEVLKDNIDEAVATAETHDAERHDGERTTFVNGMLLPSDEVVQAANETIEHLKGQDHD